METQRKVQLSAAAVVANGLAALYAIAPSTALANPCAPIYNEESICFIDAYTYCQQRAQPGCTPTSASCSPLWTTVLYACEYN